ncbi:MAG: TIGR04219 family outer membrane beta-barrel protein [Acinetobacter populi]|jgi:outer membrane protein|uniref:TIGR04219 family outer membrane beta-barrel protein n=1 Tax=Acinetobacter populi TaxID=1582270 RepID=UPI00235224AF|nr:TIGR04219 family outer membrane beta-barrel protein [Acinetobacter populi]MCH4249133.1 TIGR04219 family outer membrane beta-barrel protein [Acinetobacter populi]
MKLWHGVLLATSTFTLSNFAQADLIGIYGSVDYWNLGGDYNEGQSGSRLEGANALDMDDKGQAQFALSFEHPIPLIPNARIRHVSIDAETEQSLAGNPTFDIQLNNTDFILYYELLDNIVSADVGIAAKRLDGDVTYHNLSGKDKLNISETAPMLYGALGAKLPFTGLSAKAEALLTSYSDTKISDVSAEVKYDFVDNLLVDVGAKAGYRILNIDLDDQDGIDTKFRFKGSYIGLEAHF